MVARRHRIRHVTSIGSRCSFQPDSVWVRMLSTIPCSTKTLQAMCQICVLPESCHKSSIPKVLFAMAAIRSDATHLQIGGGADKIIGTQHPICYSAGVYGQRCGWGIGELTKALASE